VERLLALDRSLFQWLNSPDWPRWLDAFYVFITRDEPLRIPLLCLWLLLLLFCGPRWRVRALWLVPLIALSDWSASQPLKDAFARPRPCHDALPGLRLLIDCGPGFSFPSSHAANMGAAGCFLALGLAGWRRRWAALALPLLVAYSRVHVGVHYPLDVAAGWCWGMGLALGMDWLGRRAPRLRLGTAPLRRPANADASDTAT
jgi:membrane-associated phospholipid phosphatase